jgi:hypothetical protein
MLLPGKLASVNVSTNHGSWHWSLSLGSIHAKSVFVAHPLGRAIMAA